ncbi:DUF2997 domain-containing protein [Paludisphaera rhizosphaerae]|uniref:DUF2997 domain-containing protein n=1 Tax=Paludisphaera rhizosphaerae TaxID=2711216 RepID=UPI0013EACBF1|nr:DUF2997 domain-containing protein [Paludisphaera rhizosphaerae]
MSRVVEIIVGPKGETTVRTKGFAGSGCREASRFVEEALGRRTAETLTSDYHRDATIEAEQRQSR